MNVLNKKPKLFKILKFLSCDWEKSQAIVQYLLKHQVRLSQITIYNRSEKYLWYNSLAVQDKTNHLSYVRVIPRHHITIKYAIFLIEPP